MGKTVSGSVELLAGRTFKAKSGSGHAITLDEALDAGGSDHGARPGELVLLGIAGCAAMDVARNLHRLGQDVTAYEVQVLGEGSVKQPDGFGSISLEHVVRGRRVNPAAVHRAIEMSADRARAMRDNLVKTAYIDETYRVVDVDTGAETRGKLETPTGVR
jgi:putative redox protein